MATAILIPAKDEASSIASTISRWRSYLPHAHIYVGDNGSQDGTARIAWAMGATVISEPKPGKGRMVRALLHAVDADVYVMVDGDDTYQPTAESIRLQEGMVQRNVYWFSTGERVLSSGNTRPLHLLGNFLFNCLFIGRSKVTRDCLSGLRIFNRQFAQTFPLLSNEFELEMEMTVFASKAARQCTAFSTNYAARNEDNSKSKLRAFSDGAKIFAMYLQSALGLPVRRLAHKPQASTATIAALIVSTFLFFSIQ